ncbi:MAG TPA: S9 family peptidase [Thermoanaerobaculia bacterium]|nr:S9 family peptidase [Thermoanaerobaculia bacterium]
MPQRLRPLAAFVLLAALVAPPTVAQAQGTQTTQAPGSQPHPFGVRDLLAMERLSDWQASPDGRRVAFVQRSTDLEANRGRTDLWLLELDAAGAATGEPRRLTSAPQADHSPRWAPDGESLYFLSTRSGSSQVWRLPLAGGEAVQVTDLPLDVANLQVSPTGTHLAFTLEVYADCADLPCTVQRLEERQAGPATGRVYEELLFRHWDTWEDGRRNHLFTLALGPGGAAPAADATPVDVTRGLEADVPSVPFGGSEEIAFAPDGASLVFAARAGGPDEAWSTNFDLWSVPVGGGERTNLTADNLAWDTQPVFAPDGRSLAYLAMTRPGFEADQFRILLRDVASGRTRQLAQGWDRSPGSMVFAPDGRTLYVTASNLGQSSIFAVDVASGSVREVLHEGTNRSPVIAAGGRGGHRLLFGRDQLTSPVELWSVAPDGTGLAQLTDVNREQLAAVELGEPEQFRFEGAGGATVYGYVVKPVGFEAGKKYPIAFLIHGGPQGSFGNDFHYRWNPQTYAGAGYAAVMVDFHGSVGYGQEFTDAIRDDWGGKPLEDLQKGLAAALERYPWLDGDRACALGASYGGYMINWIAGRWPERFDCLVNHDGLFDNRMMYYTTEELWFPEWEHGGPYFENPEAHERQNPANHVENWQTPMLVIHGALDFRVPETQAFATFTALQRRGVPSKFLYFPDENHWVLQPANSILWHETVLGWLDQWLRP